MATRGRFLFLAALLAACAHAQDVRFDPQAVHAIGGAKYTTELLAGEKGPSTRKGNPATPKVTPDFHELPTTNDWWSSLLWAFDDDPYSRAMFPHPLAVKAEAGGLGVGYPSEPQVAARSYRYPYAPDLHLSTTGLHAPDARVKAWSDWTVTGSWTDGAKHLEATFGHGLPFVYARTGGDARITVEGDARVWSEHGEVLGVTVHGHDYGLFAPTGGAWKKDGAAFVSDLAGKGFFTVAVLPDHAPETLELFRRHAYAFVTGTRVSWSYDPKGAKVTSHFEATTALAEPGADRIDEPLLSLYPHQWKATRAPLAKASYASPRGPMRLLAAKSFDVERPFHGVLPALPAVDEDRGQIEGYLHDEAGAGNLFPAGLDGVKDTYWDGKSLGKVATMAWIAHAQGDAGTQAHLVDALARELEDWFDGQPPNRFYYDDRWKTLIGFPAGYQSNTELNDHHFHYGYFVWAAATVAALEPKRDVVGRWGAFVKMLVDDVANADDGDTRFPRLRYFDPYAGHSWASGPSMFDHGNNEESSSEDMNFAAALVLWGTIAGDTKVRDLGAFLYETLASAIDAYWLDLDHDVFPAAYKHSVAGIVWGDGAVYDTWWDRNPVYVHGINALPFTGASLYLGRRPDAVRANYDRLLTENRGPVHQWRDVLWMYLALGDPARAVTLADDDHAFDPEFGSSWAAAFSWIHGLHALGTVDAGVLADTPSYAVFRSGNARSYAAYNAGTSPLHVTFTDGATLDVAPGSLGRASRPVH
ncbi:MAG TPA: glycosyl hydrolase [Polyangiaceae bacterium]|jgi:endoglucanase Acf2